MTAWLFINLLQSYFTGLSHDEAYYYFYSTHLAWGYYDHPPMIALLIKMGYLVFHNELGVRLFISLMSVGTLILIVEITEVKNYLLFFTLLFSVTIIQPMGFIAIPDMPLIFFTTLFFYGYKKYLRQDSFANAILIMLAMAGMLYSKYPAVLVLFFTFVANLKIIRKKYFWLIVLASVLAMLPHLFWQINHDFISFYFHLFERSRNASFSIMNILGYVGGQVALMNPFVAFFLIYYAFKNKPHNVFNRVLTANVYGVFGVALLLSFIGPVEANWTITAFIPLIILAYPAIEKNLKLHKTLYVLGAVSIFLILVLRVYLVYDFVPKKKESALQSEFFGWKQWAKSIEDIAGNRPVVFANSYQKASKYLFYTGHESFTFNYLLYRKNQFDLQGVEPELAGNNVLFVYGTKGMWLYDTVAFYLPHPDSALIMGKWWYYADIPHYYSYNFLPVKIRLKNHTFKPNTLISIPVEIDNPLDTALTVRQDSGGTWLAVAFTQEGKVISYKEAEDISLLWLNKEYSTSLLVKTPLVPGNYHLRVCIRSGWLPPGLNSKVFKVKIR